MSIVSRITFSHIRDTIRSLGHTSRPLLGRWSLSENRDIAKVVKYANEDHCGPCGEMISIHAKDKSSYDQEKLLAIEYSLISMNTPDK